MAAINQGKSDHAEKMVQVMFARDEAKQWPRTHVIMGLAHESWSELEKAAEHYRAFLRIAPNAPLASVVKNKLGELAALPGVEPSTDLLRALPAGRHGGPIVLVR